MSQPTKPPLARYTGRVQAAPHTPIHACRAYNAVFVETLCGRHMKLVCATFEEMGGIRKTVTCLGCQREAAKR